MRILRRPQSYGARPTTVEISPEVITRWRDELNTSTALTGVRPARDRHAAAIHQLRQLIAICLAFTALCALFSGIVLARVTASPAPGVVTPIAGRTYAVRLVVIGSEPAAEVQTHLAFLDGDERDIAPGAYELANLRSLAMQITAGPGETGCRVIVDNVRVAEEITYDHGVVTCSWTAAP